MMMGEAGTFGLDKAAIRRSFDLAAGRYDEYAVLQREVGARLEARLELMRIEPSVVLDLGSGTGHGARLLEQRYRRARILLVDLAPAMLAEARRHQRRWRSRCWYACADAERLPIASASVDLVFSNMSMQWCGDLRTAFAECRRVLRPHGLLLFSTVGPDTLCELRTAWSTIDDQPHVNSFLDMHDVGDALIDAAFSSPVMDRDHLTLTYDDVTALMRELKAIGAHNSHAARSRALRGRAQLQRLAGAYEPFRRDGKLPATYEVVYGHAWAPAADTRPQDGSTVATFPISQLKTRPRG